MEQRHRTRTLLQFPATLELANSAPILGRIRDISPNGLFVETRSLIRFLPTYAAMTINFNLPGALSVDPFRLQAILTRRTPTGVGLMFLFKDVATSRNLSDALSFVAPPWQINFEVERNVSYLN